MSKTYDCFIKLKLIINNNNILNFHNIPFRYVISYNYNNYSRTLNRFLCGLEAMPYFKHK